MRPIYHAVADAGQQPPRAITNCAYQAVTLSSPDRNGEKLNVPHSFPSPPWTDAFKEAVNQNQDFAQASKEWTEGSLALVVEANVEAGLIRDMAILLDMHAGHCRRAAYVDAEEARKQADLVIEAGDDLWKEIVEGKLNPTMALLQWNLKVTKGRLPTVIKHAPLIRHLIVCAAQVPAAFTR